MSRTKEFGRALAEVVAIDRATRRAAVDQAEPGTSATARRVKKAKEFVQKRGLRKLIVQTTGFIFLPGTKARLGALGWMALGTAAELGSERFLNASKVFANQNGITPRSELRRSERYFANVAGALLPFFSKGDIQKTLTGVKNVNAVVEQRVQRRR